MKEVEQKRLGTVKGGRNLKIAIFIVLLLTTIYLYEIEKPDTKAKLCIDTEILKHVYNPGKLSVIDTCKTVWGTVVKVVDDGDGNAKIELRLDPYFYDTVNQANIDKLGGNMVAVIVCAYPVTQKDAVSACSGYENKIDVPKMNTHISITGQFVSDTKHGGWNEIHPVYAICGTNEPIARKKLYLIGEPVYGPCIKIV